jgi:predicted dehydrogenase
LRYYRASPENQKMSLMNRRHFLEDSMLAAAAAAAAAVGIAEPLPAEEAKPLGSPNEKLRGVVIGCHGRGGEHIAQLTNRGDVELAYICDVDTKVGNSRCEQVERNLHGHMPKYAQDLRTALDDKSVDFVTIATPNHWHSLAAIWAMQAGKDVYVEKPVSHNVGEGRRAVQAAERHKRICQTGMQSRSSQGMQDAIAYLRAGKLGEVKLARGLCYKTRLSIGPKGNYTPPKEVDYDLWSGPARILPPTRPRFHYDWHWQWPYGNGDIGNQGVHQMDIARWGLGVGTLANRVLSYGGRFGYEDAGDTPNTEVSIFEFTPDKTLVFEVRGLKTQGLLGERIGTILYGSDGYMVSPDLSSGSTLSTASVFDIKGNIVKTFGKGDDPLGNHFDNFLRAIRSRDPAGLNAPILDGHLSAALCHMGNISYRLGSPHTSGETVEKLKSLKTNEHVAETLDRVVSHLSDNSVHLEGKTEFRLGPQLQFDPKAETFIDNPAADALLTRDYRAPFVIPSAENV